MLTRRGVLVEDVGQIWLAEPDADGEEGGTLRPLQAAAISLQAAPGQWPGPSPGTNSPLDCSCPGSALSDERVQLNASGQVELKLETPWRDGTTHLVMSPLEFMQRLAALVPRPRLHLIRFQGVPAPNAKLRFLVVPQPPAAQAQTSAEAADTDGCENETVQARPHRINWARLLKRVFDIDMQQCPNRGSGEFQIIVAILERPVVEKTLTHLGLGVRAHLRKAAIDASRAERAT
jgi:hypothetical protein